ncbi:MAG: YopT-type cysteine protease domain-containing protein [Pseudomonadota bacterium]
MGKNATSDRLESYAKMLGGGRTYDFSQASAFKVAESTGPDQGKMYKMVMRNGKPMGGVCATLCAFWVVFHAQQDAPKGGHSFTRGRSVWDYLFQDGGLNTGAATNITVEHFNSTGNQIGYLDAFMKKFKVERRAKRMSGSMITATPMVMSYTTLMQCSRHMTAIGGYKLLSLKPNTNGTGPGHMVSVWCDLGDVLFMDPNYGEFWLPDRAKFAAWFQFYVMNTYRTSFKSVTVYDYVVK